MRKTLLHYLLQGTFILPTDSKKNLFKGKYNCIGWKDIDSQKKKRIFRLQEERWKRKEKKPQKTKSRVGYKLQVKTEFSSETLHSNPCFIFFICSLLKAFGHEVPYIHGCPPGKRELHKPHWGQLLRGWPRRSPSHLSL